MPYIKSLNESDLCNLILQTKKELFLVMPLLHPAVMESVNKLSDKTDGKISINLGMDFSPETFRQGYGDFESFDIQKLSRHNIQNIQDNRIAFIITDDKGYFLFIESRYLIPAEKATINAVKIDPISIVRLKHHFFKPYVKKALEDQLANAIIDESIRFKDVEQEFKSPGIVVTKEIDPQMVKAVNDDLNTNPPLKPDYKRIVEYYSTKFQYVKLNFNGANLQTKKVELPRNALPINDLALRRRLETKLNLFNADDEKIVFPELEKLKKNVLQIRKLYLVPLKIREENLLEMIKKQDFEKELEDLKKQISTVSAQIVQKIDLKIKETKASLLKELTSFYIDNPKLISENDLFLKQDSSYRKSEAENIANKIIHKISWPKAFELLSEMNLSLHYSNITFEDLSNKDLLEELITRKVITEADKTSLADFGKGIDLKNV